VRECWCRYKPFKAVQWLPMQAQSCRRESSPIILRAPSSLLRLHTLRMAAPLAPLQATTALDAAQAELRMKLMQQADAAALLEKAGASNKVRLKQLQEELDAAAAANTAAEKEHRKQLDSLKAALAGVTTDHYDLKNAVRQL
jgi:hypothetical protein